MAVEPDTAGSPAELAVRSEFWIDEAKIPGAAAIIATWKAFDAIPALVTVMVAVPMAVS